MKNAAGIARANRLVLPQSPAILRSSRSGRRAAGFNVDSQVATAFEAASTRGLVPMVPDMGPIDSTRHTRTLQRLSRHLKRNSPYFQGLVRVMKDTYANTGPVPVSRHSELVDLWHASADEFDGRGVHGFPSGGPLASHSLGDRDIRLRLRARERGQVLVVIGGKPKLHRLPSRTLESDGVE